MKDKYSLNTLHLLPRYVFIKKCIETHPQKKEKKKQKKEKERIKEHHLQPTNRKSFHDEEKLYANQCCLHFHSTSKYTQFRTRNNNCKIVDKTCATLYIHTTYNIIYIDENVFMKPHQNGKYWTEGYVSLVLVLEATVDSASLGES